MLDVRAHVHYQAVQWQCQVTQPCEVDDVDQHHRLQRHKSHVRMSMIDLLFGLYPQAAEKLESPWPLGSYHAQLSRDLDVDNKECHQLCLFPR